MTDGSINDKVLYYNKKIRYNILVIYIFKTISLTFKMLHILEFLPSQTTSANAYIIIITAVVVFVVVMLVIYFKIKIYLFLINLLENV